MTRHIPIPSDFTRGQTPQASLSIHDRPDGSQSLQAGMPPTSGREKFSSVTQKFMASSPVNQGQNGSGQQPLDRHPTFSDQVYSQLPGYEQEHCHPLDYPQIAVDFVLEYVRSIHIFQFIDTVPFFSFPPPMHPTEITFPSHSLEQPCLRHHRTHTYPDGETNGHALMLQSPIMSRCPAPIKTDTKRERIDPSVTWSMPAWEIEKLLKLSRTISLEGEITPVEAWQRIKQHPAWATLDQERLDALKQVLAPEVMCYGFGAVIDEEYFETILQQQLAIEPAAAT